MRRHENLKILENHDVEYLEDLKTEQKIYQAVGEMEKFWPEHKWLVQNKVNASAIDEEI